MHDKLRMQSQESKWQEPVLLGDAKKHQKLFFFKREKHKVKEWK